MLCLTLLSDYGKATFISLGCPENLILLINPICNLILPEFQGFEMLWGFLQQWVTGKKAEDKYKIISWNKIPSKVGIFSPSGKLIWLCNRYKDSKSCNLL